MSQNDALLQLDRELRSLVQTRSGRRLFLWSLSSLLASCASSSGSRYREGDNTGQQAALTPEEERRLANEALIEMRKDYPAVPDQGLQSYVQSLGQDLVRANGLAGRPYQYQFSVVQVAMVNAFALPAGTVMVTAPLIAMAETEAELVGVLGHEVGHITARHTAERMFAAKKAQNRSWLFGLGGGLAGAAVGVGVGKLVCREQDRQCLINAAQLGAITGASGGLLIQKYGFMANSREDEMEADRIGFRTAVRSGYHKDYVGKFYEKLLQMEQKSKQQKTPILASIADAMSTHPPSRERVNQMRQMASDTSNHSSHLKVSSKEFDRWKRQSEKYVKVG